MNQLAALAPHVAATVGGGPPSTGETVLFWVLAPIMVLAALGLLFARRAMYAAVCLVVIMVALAFLYTAQGAPFLGVTQVIVYTGAIMMLILFVLMLVGVDASDSLHETIRHQRPAAIIGGLGLLLVLVGVGLSAVPLRDAAGLGVANADSNPVGVARLIFSDFVFTMEITGALLITAALGAVVLAHRERIYPRKTQRDVADEKMAGFGQDAATRINNLPAPGVYARSNAADLPAIAGTGQEPVRESVPRILRIRGQARTVGEVSPETVLALAEQRSGRGHGVHGAQASRSVDQARLPGMPGEAAPVPLVPGSPAAEELEASRAGADRALTAEPEDQR